MVRLAASASPFGPGRRTAARRRFVDASPTHPLPARSVVAAAWRIGCCAVLQYLQSWFLLDLVSTLPWDLMFNAINQSSEADVGA